jgi:TonB family protein
MMGSEMVEHRTEYEGQTVGEGLVLGKYLGGSERGGVFLTELGGPEPRRAAVKIIPAEEVDAEAQLSRWNAAAQLSHPHLLRIFKSGRCELGGREHCYAVMEFAEEDLSQILPQRALTPAEAREMLKPVLGALAFLHARGFVHGHIKPSNIMAVEDQLKISSDGLCSAGERRGDLMRPCNYDAPEIANGEILPVADVWSLGVTLVEILTQRLPLQDGTAGRDPDLPDGLASPFLEIARHCLRSDPRRRWTIGDIAARLDAPISEPRRQAEPPPKQAGTKRRYIVPVVVVAAVILAALGVPRLFKRPVEVAAPSSAPQPSGGRTSAPQKLLNAPAKSPARKGAGEKQKSGYVKQQSSPGPAVADLKIPTGKVVRGEVLRQVMPSVPQQARDTIRGTVRVAVRVSIDPSGNVVGAALDSPGPSRYFANLALEAARQWEFAPAKVDGRSVASEWILRFEFDNNQTKAFPTQARP